MHVDRDSQVWPADRLSVALFDDHQIYDRVLDLHSIEHLVNRRRRVTTPGCSAAIRAATVFRTGTRTPYSWQARAICRCTTAKLGFCLFRCARQQFG